MFTYNVEQRKCTHGYDHHVGMCTNKQTVESANSYRKSTPHKFYLKKSQMKNKTGKRRQSAVDVKWIKTRGEEEEEGKKYRKIAEYLC